MLLLQDAISPYTAPHHRGMIIMGMIIARLSLEKMRQVLACLQRKPVCPSTASIVDMKG